MTDHHTPTAANPEAAETPESEVASFVELRHRAADADPEASTPQPASGSIPAESGEHSPPESASDTPQDGVTVEDADTASTERDTTADAAEDGVPEGGLLAAGADRGAGRG